MKRLSLVLALSLMACATQRATGDVSPVEKRNNITAEEIATARSPGWYAYELINSLRPTFLRPHNAQTMTSRDPIYADVYLNETYHGDINSLKSLPIEGITSITYLPPFDAAMRFGKEMEGGAIMIRTH
jgi:hypothetical protein